MAWAFCSILPQGCLQGWLESTVLDRGNMHLEDKLSPL